MQRYTQEFKNVKTYSADEFEKMRATADHYKEAFQTLLRESDPEIVMYINFIPNKQHPHCPVIHYEVGHHWEYSKEINSGSVVLATACHLW